ncbi:MAG: T9SS type A sorting domain-containing protein [Candidatus Cloacimonetes bacterium]|nr:T9SS type A sorting domain-containing protein [Candidatus Cloacimonadota bacterium]
MKYLLLLFLFFLIVSQLFCQIDFYIETDETSYSYGQDIYITFNVHNTSVDTVYVTVFNIFPFSYYIDDEYFSPGSLPGVFDLLIPPNTTYSEDYIHTENVSNGNHILVGEFHCMPPYLVSDPISITIGQVSVSFYELQQIGFQLSNYPNPFNPTTTISFSIPEESTIELSIFNIKGQKIKSLLNDQLTAGEHSITWNGEDFTGKKVSSGIYFYKLITPNASHTKKMLLLK